MIDGEFDESMLARRVDQLVDGEVETRSHEEVMAEVTARLEAIGAARKV